MGGVRLIILILIVSAIRVYGAKKKHRTEDANHDQVQKVSYLYLYIFVFIIKNGSSSAFLSKPCNDKIYTCISILCHSCFDLARSVMNGAGFWTES